MMTKAYSSKTSGCVERNNQKEKNKDRSVTTVLFILFFPKKVLKEDGEKGGPEEAKREKTKEEKARSEEKRKK